MLTCYDNCPSGKSIPVQSSPVQSRLSIHPPNLPSRVQTKAIRLNNQNQKHRPPPPQRRTNQPLLLQRSQSLPLQQQLRLLRNLLWKRLPDIRQQRLFFHRQRLRRSLRNGLGFLLGRVGFFFLQGVFGQRVGRFGDWRQRRGQPCRSCCGWGFSCCVWVGGCAVGVLVFYVLLVLGFRFCCVSFFFS